MQEQINLFNYTFCIYTRRACQPCKVTKQWLMRRNVGVDRVQFIDCDDPEAVVPPGVRAVPFVLVVDNGVVVDQWTGFQPTKMEQYL